jgi:hypothetical protein
MPPAQAWRYLRAATIGLSPFPRSRTLEVASPTKVCEYMAYGVPVVANDQPDQAALLAQTGGGLCVPLTAQGFAQGVLTLLADPARARAMAEQGRARIAGLRSYDVLATQLAAQYRKLLGRNADDEAETESVGRFAGEPPCVQSGAVGMGGDACMAASPGLGAPGGNRPTELAPHAVAAARPGGAAEESLQAAGAVK